MRNPQMEIRYAVTATDIWGPGAERVAHELTDIEVQLLRHAARGLSDKQIASVVDRAPKTVRYHIRQVRRKLNMRTRFQLALHLRGLLTKDNSDA